MLEPNFVLHASDPASSEALRAYIDKRKKQGANSLEVERLHKILLEFSGWVRSQTRPPMLQPGPVSGAKKPEPEEPMLAPRPVKVAKKKR